MDLMDTKRVAIMAANGFELSELKRPLEDMRAKGADVDILSIDQDEIKSWDQGNWSEKFEVNKSVADVTHEDYDVLILPGGVINPDKLRRHDSAVSFVRECHNNDVPVAAICHAGWMLIEADILEGKRATSFHSIKTDMKNAGARWENNEVVVDQGLITSRSPADLDAFLEKITEEITQRDAVATA